MRRGVRHAEDKFLEPLQGIWSYACQPDGAGREKRRREDTDSLKEVIKDGGRKEMKKNSGGREEVSSSSRSDTEPLHQFVHQTETKQQILIRNFNKLSATKRSDTPETVLVTELG